MAQRWMQAKMQTAKSHGITRSGASRPMGHVSDDKPVNPAKPDLSRNTLSAEETARLAADYLANHRVTKCPRATPKASTFYRDKARLVSAAYDRAGLISPRVKPGMVRH
jgi:hypothetical protein